nr:immunoglobulin heavy chain junction region [Mus musculus]MBK4188911.1 immunoglobulin heavy chain junction region [Mus musculus]MBK4188912.1 immunoglobulin heavy chain junction region [Mus musculus]
CARSPYYYGSHYFDYW